jgi:hypothetical protein
MRGRGRTDIGARLQYAGYSVDTVATFGSYWFDMGRGQRIVLWAGQN